MAVATYDRIGIGYRDVRRPDPRTSDSVRREWRINSFDQQSATVGPVRHEQVNRSGLGEGG